MFGQTFAQRAEWRLWFAWHPVLLEDGRVAWLRWLERRWPPPDPPGRVLGHEYRLPARSLGHWLPKARR